MSQGVRYASTTVALVLIGLVSVLGQAWLDRPAPLPRNLKSAGRPALRVPPPMARELLERADALALTTEQRARLVVLDRTWSEAAGGLEQAVAAGRAEFERFTREASPRGASIAQIQGASAEYRERSAVLREARQRHTDAAQAVLTEAQRRSLARGSFTTVQGGSR